MTSGENERDEPSPPDGTGNDTHGALGFLQGRAVGCDQGLGRRGGRDDVTLVG